MPYVNEHAVRINSPDKYVRFARKKIGDGISIIIGWTEEGKSEVQAYRFDKDKWTLEQIKNWLKEHKIDYKEIEEAKGEEKMELENTLDLQDILIFPRGKFFIQHLDRWIEFDNSFFNEILASFADENLAKPFIDKNHEKGESFGDIEELYIADDGLHAKIKLNEKGVELIKGREYKYISPWFGAFTDTQGKKHKWVLFSVSLTNIPALSGELPELQEQMQLEMEARMEKTKQMYEKIKDVAMQKKWIQLEDEEKDFDTRVAELLEALYNNMLSISDIATQVETLLAEKKSLQEKVEQTEAEMKKLEQEKLEKEAEEVIKLAVENGQYPVALFEMKKQQYIKDKELILKELELIPKKESVKMSSSAVAVNLAAEDIEVMKNVGLNPADPKDVEFYKKVNKIK